MNKLIRRTYRVYFAEGNRALFEATDIRTLCEYLNTKKDYYYDITKIEKVKD